jgi:hypothetical protein
MSRWSLCLFSLLCCAGVARAEEPRAAGDKEMSGMSVVGNDDAPKALVIVPWKSSVLADTLSVSRSLDAGRQPVDREVFLRELAYYRIRASSATESSSGAR